MKVKKANNSSSVSDVLFLRHIIKHSYKCLPLFTLTLFVKVENTMNFRCGFSQTDM